jgi:hypothetical protein
MVISLYSAGGVQAEGVSRIDEPGEKDSQIPPIEENSVFGLHSSEMDEYLRQDVTNPDNQGVLVQAMCKFLRTRDAIFGNMLYSDPSWETILLLHAARTENRPVTFADLSAVLLASSETLTRCISMLESNDLVTRRDIKPVPVLELSTKALEMIDRMFKTTPNNADPVWENLKIASKAHF